MERGKEKEKVRSEKGKEREEPTKCPISAPFPQRLQKAPNHNLHTKMYELFKQVKVNIPLLDAIKQVASHANFLKGLCTVKRKLQVHKNAFAACQASSII